MNAVLKLRVKLVADESNIWQHKKAKAARYSAWDLKNLRILLENSAEGLGGQERVLLGLCICLLKYTQKVVASSP